MRRPYFPRRHLDIRTALDYLDDHTGAADRARVEDHLAGPCERCRELMHDAARLVELMRGDRVAEVSKEAHARALEVFGARPMAPEPSGLQWRPGSLVFDSLRDPLSALARRAVGEARWLRFVLDGHVLELEADPEARGAWTLRGRLAVLDPALHRIEVEVAGESLGVWPDAEGRFVVERVPAGEIQMVVKGPGQRYRLPRFAL